MCMWLKIGDGLRVDCFDRIWLLFRLNINTCLFCFMFVSYSLIMYDNGSTILNVINYCLYMYMYLKFIIVKQNDFIQQLKFASFEHNKPKGDNYRFQCQLILTLQIE